MEKTGGKGLTKNIKVILAVAAAAVAAICVIVVIVQVVSSSKPENSSIVVYRQNGENIVRIGDKETVVSNRSASDFKCDAESDRVFFTVDSSYSDGLYDLYYIGIESSEITEPKIIDYGIESGFEVASGKVYYLKKNEQAASNDGCVCDIDNGKIEVYSSNVEKFMTLDSNVMYFTKMHGDNEVLYKYSSGSPIEVCRDLVNIFKYDECENPHIVYEKSSSIHAGMTELYIAYAEGAPELICDSTYEVMFDEYSPDGNLYYFTSSTENISWSYVIADQYIESDKNVTKPKRDNFFAIFGVSAEYNEALREYQDKLVRDEIRAALNESMENGEFSAPVFNAFAYNSEGSFKVAENIDPEKVYSVSTHGEPKIIFESEVVTANATDMGALVDIAQRSTMTEVIEYARSVVSGSVASEGMAFAAYTNGGAVSYKLEGYDQSKTMFSFSDDGNRIFAFVRDSQGERLNLYTNNLGTNLMPSSEISIDTGITSYRFVNGSVLYLKADIGKNTGDVYAFDGENITKLSNAANAFTVEKSNDIIILKQHDSLAAKPTADYYIYKDSEEQLIVENAVVESFSFAESGKAAYVTDSDDGNKLCIYSNGKSVSVASDVSDILFFE